MSDEPRPLPEEWVMSAREHYHAPGPTPSDEMWAVIEARIEGDRAAAMDASPGTEATEVESTTITPIRAGGAGSAPRRGWVPILAAASLALLLGVGLGRRSVTSVPTVTTPAAAPNTADTGAEVDSGPGTAVRLAAARHLGDAEALLAVVAADVREGRPVGDVGAWGRGLLTRTRLFMDSPVADDPNVRVLLEELELVLAQVALLGDPSLDDARRSGELQLLAADLNDGGVRERIRAALPGMDPVRFAADDD